MTRLRFLIPTLLATLAFAATAQVDEHLPIDTQVADGTSTNIPLTSIKPDGWNVSYDVRKIRWSADGPIRTTFTEIDRQHKVVDCSQGEAATDKSATSDQAMQETRLVCRYVRMMLVPQDPRIAFGVTAQELDRAWGDVDSGLALAKAGNRAKAVAALQGALKVLPGETTVHALVADLLIADKRPAEALPHLEAVARSAAATEERKRAQQAANVWRAETKTTEESEVKRAARLSEAVSRHYVYVIRNERGITAKVSTRWCERQQDDVQKKAAGMRLQITGFSACECSADASGTFACSAGIGWAPQVIVN